MPSGRDTKWRKARRKSDGVLVFYRGDRFQYHSDDSYDYWYDTVGYEVAEAEVVGYTVVPNMHNTTKVASNEFCKYYERVNDNTPMYIPEQETLEEFYGPAGA
jgi:hypothetical protein